MFVKLSKEEVVTSAEQSIAEGSAKAADAEVFCFFFCCYANLLFFKKFIGRLQKENENLQKQFETFIREHTYNDSADS